MDACAPGVISVGFGVVIFFLLPGTPERVKRRFTAAEKQIALRRTKEAFNIPHTRPNLRQILDALKDPKTWFFCTAPSSTACLLPRPLERANNVMRRRTQRVHNDEPDRLVPVPPRHHQTERLLNHPDANDDHSSLRRRRRRRHRCRLPLGSVQVEGTVRCRLLLRYGGRLADSHTQPQ